jgi:pantothenate kinase-related protein Tda10
MKGCGMKWSWPNLKYPLICLVRLRKSREVWSLEPKFEPGTARMRSRSANQSAAKFRFIYRNDRSILILFNDEQTVNYAWRLQTEPAFVAEYNFSAWEPVYNMFETLLTTLYGLDSLKTCNNDSTVSTQILADHLKAQNCHKVCVASS